MSDRNPVFKSLEQILEKKSKFVSYVCQLELEILVIFLLKRGKTLPTIASCMLRSYFLFIVLQNLKTID